MSIQQSHGLLLDGSVRQFTFASSPVVRKSKAAKARPVDTEQEGPTKFDWFLALLYVIVAFGILVVAWLMLAFLTPSQPAPLP